MTTIVRDGQGAPAGGPTAAAARWQATHVHYAGNADPMIVHGIAPLVRDLRERGLVERWFFIKYWLEGPHVRLRLLPAAGVDPELVRSETRAALTAFLRRRPALYEADADGLADLYHRMFLAEYGQERWDETYGESGMPLRANNSCHEMPYEREYGRYGGVAGVELAEWHFEVSSDLVAGLLRTTNVHVRTVLLGLAAQLSATMCFSFLGTAERVAKFLDDYRTFWETTYQENSDEYHESFDKSYARMADKLAERVAAAAEVALDHASAADSDARRGWASHCADLRDRVAELARAGALEFSRGPVADVDGASAILLSSYLHMTNNRLGVSILDEIYLSYVLRRAVLDLAGSGALR
ncbi:thiopeptide-type bacteriocin biosynthesis protein [Saccharothrix algeriensis]|uniref:Thiopeptide-type bacteriocin biosynthesis protein n=1 Tax=Saccharothrix algeriensis TaxID=173560 RepID=A0A8T8HWT1_9PSEU|nr:thiopeptide-type bacteriocin biosynthesis protein [Saccharothrix algeriensis]MBM7814549.1 thiopeptide-type bacteriocin biosynthesis protein [Saccharothrix algeriensis]QTR02841.1 thiopeptide-type bacteriocin biosynthesis protein [Saccharothrix algeriensis]